MKLGTICSSNNSLNKISISVFFLPETTTLIGLEPEKFPLQNLQPKLIFGLHGPN